MIKKTTPDEAGAWIEDGGSNGTYVILIAKNHGWDGTDAEEPDVNIISLAERELSADPTLTEDEQDRLTFRYPMFAEEWLNANVAPPGYKFGWHGPVFYLQSDRWWEPRGGPDQMWLP